MHSRPFHTVAVGAAVLAMVVIFFPTLFFGRVISPLDVVYNDSPWRSVHHPVEVTNPELREPATAFLPLAAAVHREGLALDVWNPYLAGGRPGAATWSNGLLSPAVLPFVFWLDPALLMNVMVLVKLLLAFAGCFLLLRRFALSEAAATVGAMAFALCGPVTSWWLWPASATSAALPLLLWAIDRTLNSDRPWRSAAVTAGACLAFLTGGAPGPTLLGAYMAVAWTLVRLRHAPRHSPARWQRLAAVAAAATLAIAILAPAFALFSGSLRGSGVLDQHPTRTSWGWSAVRLLVDPLAYGDPRQESFAPPVPLENLSLHEISLNIGLITAALAAVGLAAGRHRRAFWIMAASVGLLALAVAPVARLLFRLPGLASVPSQRLAPEIALALCVLAAFGVEALMGLVRTPLARRLAAVLAVAVILQQGLAAGHLLAFLPRREATLPSTRGLAFLSAREQQEPDRIAPLLDTLWPDTAQMFGLEDVRSQFSSTTGYRRLIKAIDPQAWGHFGRLIRLNAATIDLTHPYLKALGARWIVEDPALELVQFVLGQMTTEVEPQGGLLGPLRSGQEVVQVLHLPHGCSRVGLRERAAGDTASGRVTVTLFDEEKDSVVGTWYLDAAALKRTGLRWLDLPPALDLNHRFRLRIAPRLERGALWLPRSASAHALDGRLFWNGRRSAGDLALVFDTSGYVLAYQGRDLRIWENRHARPRFWLVRSARNGNLETLLAANPPLDLVRTAVAPANIVAALSQNVPLRHRGVAESLELLSRGPAFMTLRSRLGAPALLVSSVPASAGLWRLRIDGRPLRSEVVNGLFLGALLPPGNHIIEARAVMPWWWMLTSAAGMAMWLGIVCLALSRRRPDQPPVGES
ncbi:MAG: YfhO family protein [Acidobacteria bacterium]|nr:YfhO family protein [Acidobacteriota bacterium]